MNQVVIPHSSGSHLLESKKNFVFSKTISNNSNLQVNILKTSDETTETFWSNADNYR